MVIKILDEFNKPGNWFAYSRFLKSFNQTPNGMWQIGPDLQAWLSEHCESWPVEVQAFQLTGEPLGFGLYFENDEDAVLFRITWCE